MKLPFTVEEFLEVFKNYNNAVFPMQVILYLLAVVVILFAYKKNNWSNKGIAAILAFFWLWMGTIYNLCFFTTINKAAYLFGTLFILQGVLFSWKGVFQNKLSFHISKNRNSIAGLILVLFSLIIYPLIGYLLGHVYPASPTFGLPCPTTIFTFGMFLFMKKKCSAVIYFIPFLWAAIGFTAAISLGIKEDIALLVSGLLTAGLLIFNNRKTVNIIAL